MGHFHMPNVKPEEKRKLTQPGILLSIVFYLALFSVAFIYGSASSHAAEIESRAESELIEKTLNDYIEGTSYNRPAQISRAFHPTAILYLEKRDKSEWHVSVKEYAKLFAGKDNNKSRSKGKNKSNGRIGEILNIDIDGRIATAQIAIILPERNTTYIDQLLLKKFNNTESANKWLIVAKSAVPFASNHNGKRILFIASSANVHGDSDIPAGVSFSEIVKAYKTFTDAGYTVDFVSPEGGPLPLAYINAKDDLHVQHLYNSDFMYAIANSKTPKQIQPENYTAVHYLGGSNAMYGVAENQAIQYIVMEIYEKHNGIISSVCHGTAGIISLKTQDGEYLVKNKRISGYPESYENQDRAFFKEFPFLIQQTIEARGGDFRHGKRNTAHVEVDGRIVTGQNHLSSEGVAKEMIKLLEM